jgi:insertion element IS1 protein InsB
MQCPRCHGTRIVKNGSIHTGKAKWMCKECGRQFVAEPVQRRVSDATKESIDRLLLERLSLAGIARATGVSPRWLQYYVNQKYAAVPRSVEVTEQKRGT